MNAVQEEVRSGLADIVNEIAGVPHEEVLPDKNFADDLDVDSLSMVEVVVAAEERFGVTIPDEAAGRMKTVSDAIDYILAQH
ncbi:acyl carrier protein [Streptomyces sp. NPDC057280]|uniref:acyl carrier protein n=1 Tax=Streptomyces sp. NPDC057280 TaxID=3346081 RepID=UPI003632D72A